MGHKINAVSFRLGKNWESNYFFNNRNVLTKYTVEDILIKDYIQQVCLHQKIFIFNFKLFRINENILIFFNIFIYQRRRKKKNIFKKKKKN